MEIVFKTNKLKKQLTVSKDLLKTLGQRAKKVNQRIEELKAAENLSIMGLIPAAKCHELKGNRKGQLAVKVSDNYRLIFEPNHDPTPRKEDGGLNWEQITVIKILEIKDYH